MKFVFDEGEKVFAVRDISARGLGVSLLEFGENLLFPPGYRCRAELKLGSQTLLVEVAVARVSAWSVGFTFESLPAAHQDTIRDFIDPLHIGSSLRLVEKAAAPEAFQQGLSAWYHGDSGTDFFFWADQRGGMQRALFCLGNDFWEWREDGGVATGTLERLEGEKVVFHKSATPDPQLRRRVRKVLEHAGVLDYRLVSFLREKT
jgi:hypothetical protein